MSTEATPACVVVPAGPDAFITACSGDGKPYVKIQFATLREMQDYHRRLVTAAPAPPPMSEARIKPLEWVGPHLKMYVAEPICGLQYRITCDERGIDWFVDGGWSPVGTLDEAKAAAQADYEARIRAALFAPQPAAVPSQAEDGAQSVREACDWPTGTFYVIDTEGEHDPSYAVMPGGAMIPLNHHAGKNASGRPVDTARAEFIVNACNAALAGAGAPNRASLVADAIEACDWSAPSIGNKAVLQEAVSLLRGRQAEAGDEPNDEPNDALKALMRDPAPWEAPAPQPAALPSQAEAGAQSVREALDAAICRAKYLLRRGVDDLGRGEIDTLLRMVAALPAAECEDQLTRLTRERDEALKALELCVPVVCGQNNLFPAERVGCGCAITRETDVFRCTDCGTPFHRECAKAHFGQHDALSPPSALAGDASPSAPQKAVEALEECADYIESPLRMSRDEDESARRAGIASRARSTLSEIKEALGNG
jgi:hypothetical protein